MGGEYLRWFAKTLGGVQYVVEYRARGGVFDVYSKQLGYWRWFARGQKSGLASSYVDPTGRPLATIDTPLNFDHLPTLARGVEQGWESVPAADFFVIRFPSA